MFSSAMLDKVESARSRCAQPDPRKKDIESPV